MMGTLATLLAGKKIRTSSDLFSSLVTGEIKDVNGTLKITNIKVEHTLNVSKDKHDDAMEAFNSYLPHCPGAQSVIGCIDITHKIIFEEGE